MDFQLLFSAFKAQPAHAHWPQQRQLHECLRHGIRSGNLASGTRLPASRTLAAELGVARNSVLYAYEQLATEGFIVATRRGSVVAPLAGRLVAGSAPVLSIPAGRASLSRRVQNMPLLPGSETAAAFAPGVPALGDFPVLRWRRMLDKAWASLTPAQLNYAYPAGEPALREAIASHLRVARGALVDAAQVFITDGTQCSLDLCARSFADAGDKVWMENPGYQGAVAAFRAAQLKAVGILVDADGMAPTDSDWRRQRPRLIYTTPSHQYPVGSVMSLARRLALIDGARQAGALVIEDDYDSEFRHEGPPLACMQGLAPDAPVVYLGTFSKTMFPGLRIGFMVVPTALAPVLALMLDRAAPRGRTADQRALAEFIVSGQFAQHLRRMRRLYRQRRDVLVAALAEHLGDVATVHGGTAGMHLALRLHDGAVDDVALSACLMAKHSIMAPALSLHAVGLRAQPWRGFLLGYAQVPVEAMEPLVKKLAGVVRCGA
ncbi:PLP-dependent aminotransferase family protein [Acidovorax sp. HMWF029]|uniref:MocR-like pyridoxine biosynthesis transcription factor PdxR n=1 Tax=unclassified Acidovorax TaxID=2684926 RepID=UPI000D3676B4|nr:MULTISPECIES: PLP-dependent aminotransferase family protein [unclassified Acidovorax]MDH4419425.1 PLP-dependent aminotransferase family protein [Acidovorax sp.]PTT21102.1 PLP-dependent aminotransferase family protein [Acidovorax sp. HMWF029]